MHLKAETMNARVNHVVKNPLLYFLFPIRAVLPTNQKLHGKTSCLKLRFHENLSNYLIKFLKYETGQFF